MSRVDKHTCPAIGCKNRIKMTFAFCHRHWSLLPRELQVKIWAEWRAARWPEHKELIRDAIKLIGEREGQPCK